MQYLQNLKSKGQESIKIVSFLRYKVQNGNFENFMILFGQKHNFFETLASDSLEKLFLSFPNVLVMATSNLSDAVDPAFLDRADIKEMIPLPKQNAVYSIYRSCFNELAKVFLIIN